VKIADDHQHRFVMIEVFEDILLDEDTVAAPVGLRPRECPAL
jgi:hypothetical protein